MPRARAHASAAVFLALWTAQARAASLDITAEHRMRAVSYTGLTMVPGRKDDASFISQSTRLGFALKNIDLGQSRGESQTMDIQVKLRALGNGTAVPAPPFDQAANLYPNVAYGVFPENAALVTHRLGGVPWDVVFGRQSFAQGSGLLLDDNGAGLTGVSARGSLPWWGLKAEGAVLQARPTVLSAGSSIDFISGTLELPSEGTWTFNQLIERDKRDQIVAAGNCLATPASGTTPPTTAAGVTPGCLWASKATRWFSSLHYRLRYGPLVFDAEAAIQRGAAVPTGFGAAGNHVTYKGNAQVMKAKWRQTFYRSKETGRKIEGLARMSFARGSGDDPSTLTTDEAFFPSHGRRFDGLEREGFGELFAATPYDAFGGHSTATASGLPRGLSGIVAGGLGVTPPAWRGIVLDLDYFLYQAEKGRESRGLGTELDIRLRHDIRDRLSIKLSAAFFRGGAALHPAKPTARRYLLEATGRF